MNAPALLQRSQQRLSAATPARAGLSLASRPAAAAPLRRSQKQHICRAEGGDAPQSSTTTEGQQQQPVQPAAAQQEQPKAPLLAPGQGTAIVTGAISIIFGIAYLVLVSLLDMRGGELQPPPPEAFMQ